MKIKMIRSVLTSNGAAMSGTIQDVPGQEALYLILISAAVEVNDTPAILPQQAIQNGIDRDNESIKIKKHRGKK